MVVYVNMSLSSLGCDGMRAPYLWGARLMQFLGRIVCMYFGEYNGNGFSRKK